MGEPAALAGLPEWLGAAAAGVATAALGYVAKLLLDWWGARRSARAARYARLAELSSLLSASRASFLVQQEQAVRLEKMVRANHPDAPPEAAGYERILSSAYPSFTRDEHELHAIVRGITVFSLRPTNRALLDWVRSDQFFKGRRRGFAGELARMLSDLETHLLLWHAKYEAWVPDHPEHALVYLWDEERHGVKFPEGIDRRVEEALSRRW